MRLLTALFTTILLVSCQEVRKRETIDQGTPMQDGFVIEKEKKVRRDFVQNAKRAAQNTVFQRDSDLQFNRDMRNDSMKVIRILRKHLNDSSYSARFKLPSSLWVDPTEIRIDLGNLFSSNHRHAIVRRTFENGTNIEIFSISDNNLKCVLSEYREWYAFNYHNDTVKDVNGDRLNDFVVETFASAGCCFRQRDEVFVYKIESGKFHPKVDFTNASYDPVNKLVTGVGYGYWPERYTYQWVENRIDTIEVLEPITDDNGTVTSWDLHRPGRKTTRLKKLPERYGE